MDVFSALADPTRRSIVELLSRGERPAGEIGARFKVSAPAISQHLKALREVGLVSARVDGQRRIYRLRREGWEELYRWIEQVAAFWPQRLDALERALRAEMDEDDTAGGKTDDG